MVWCFLYRIQTNTPSGPLFVTSTTGIPVAVSDSYPISVDTEALREVLLKDGRGGGIAFGHASLRFAMIVKGRYERPPRSNCVLIPPPTKKPPQAEAFFVVGAAGLPLAMPVCASR
jgi:hypothetical protein